MSSRVNSSGTFRSVQFHFGLSGNITLHITLTRSTLCAENAFITLGIHLMYLRKKQNTKQNTLGGNCFSRAKRG